MTGVTGISNMPPGSPMRIVVVGASIAGISAARALRRHGYEGQLIIVGSETHPPYDRPPLSKQALTAESIPDMRLDASGAIQAEWRLGATAVELDLERREVALDDGHRLAFDGLVIATGTTPRRLPMARPLGGVHYLRTLDDAHALRTDLVAATRGVAVIGGGFIGAEVAASCRARGLPVTIVDAAPLPLEPVIGPEMAELCAQVHREQGVQLRLGAAVVSFEGEERVEGVELGSGEILDADVAVIGIGVVPVTDWLTSSGVTLDDGVVCDQWLRVLGASGQPVPGVVAAGDVCRWRHPGYGEAIRVEHWENAVAQGEAAAASLVRGDAAAPYAAIPYFWSDQHGIKIQFVGRRHPGDELTIVDGAPADRRFAAEYRQDGRLVAALGFNRSSRIMRYRRSLVEAAGSGVTRVHHEIGVQ
jgi:3-phenylpropionate/trans-cinnamate dioxygenase ferredoxin reductase component